MENKVCLDTDLLIDFLRNDKDAVECINELEKDNNLTTTLINIFELYYGAFKSKQSGNNLKSVERLVERLEILNLSLNSAKKAGEILAKLEREGKLIDFRDILIGTIAMEENYSVKTKNLRDFRKIPGLSII